jgi:hypothetical protein
LIIDTVTIEKRFNGPPQSANGGWAGGLLASRLSAASHKSAASNTSAPFNKAVPALQSVSVSLKAPPPLGVELTVHLNEDESMSLKYGELELAHAQLEQFDLSLPSIPSLDQAIVAGVEGLQRGLSRASWPYAKCFACGVSRDDGLCITPSPWSLSKDAKESSAPNSVAALWTPSAWLADDAGEVKLEALWAALDCPAGIAWSYQLPDGAAMVTARMSVRIEKRPRINQACIVLGWPIEQSGRKLYAGTALLNASGELLASSHQLWLLPKST